MLEDYLALRPERKEELHRFIREGRIQIGPWYLQNDTFLTSAHDDLVCVCARECGGVRRYGSPVSYRPHDEEGDVTLADLVFSFEKGEEVLRELGLERWLLGMPDGLDSPLESAGEAQLLAFAHVFLSDPGLIVLDEASSRLDPATERLMEQAIGRLLEGGTCIIIAHRLVTVERADKILILDNGRMAEYGERKRLAADPQSRFARMLQTGLEEVLA